MNTSSQSSLTHLGWPEVVRALAGECRLPAGRRRAEALSFLASAAEVREALAQVEEARQLGEARLTLPLGMSGAPEEHVDRAGKGGVLEPAALRECASLVRAAARTRRFLEARAAQSPRLWAVAQGNI